MKDGLSKVGDRRERRAANVDGEGLGRSALSLPSEPGIAAGGEVRGEDSKTDEGEDNPVPRPADSGSIIGGRDPGRSDDHTDGGEDGQKHLHLHPQVEVEGGPGRESGDQADVPPLLDTGNRTPTPVSRGGESEGI